MIAVSPFCRCAMVRMSLFRLILNNAKVTQNPIRQKENKAYSAFKICMSFKSWAMA